MRLGSDLQHTAAVLMIQDGYPPKMLQEIMGYASITTTLDLYGHLYPGEMDCYTDRLDEAAGGGAVPGVRVANWTWPWCRAAALSARCER